VSRVALTRLVIAGNRASRLRLAGMVAGVMVGVTLLLLLAGAFAGVGARGERSSWTQPLTGPPLTTEDHRLEAGESAVAWQLDHVGTRTITVVRVADPRGDGPAIPGVATPPPPGGYVVSPALGRLIEQQPADQLGDRYGRRTGTITRSGLQSPDSLVVVVGASLDDLLASGAGPMAVAEFPRTDYQSPSYRTIAVIGAFAVLIPVLLLIAIVTELGSAQRAERFAALRLIGATPRTVAGIATLETAATTVVGAVLGVGLGFVTRPLAARVQVGDGRFFLDDLRVRPLVVLAVVVLITAATAAIAWWRTLRSDVGPLGGSRERRERPPRWVSLLPLLVGVLSLAASVKLAGASSSVAEVVAVGGFLLVAPGLVWAGPLLTWVIAGTGSRLARSGAQVIALGRLRQHPRSAFRAVSGLVVAVYLVTVFGIGVTTAIGTETVVSDHRHLATSTVVGYLTDEEPARVDRVRRTLARVHGATAAAIGYDGTDGTFVLTGPDAAGLGLSVPVGAGFVRVDDGYLFTSAAEVRAASGVDRQRLVPRFLLVANDGHPGSVERIRTALATSGLRQATPAGTRADLAGDSARLTENQFAAMAYTGILIAAALSAVSLTVASLASVLDRKRVLGLLRLMGMSRRALRAVVTAEAVVPVVTVFAGSIALGVFTAWAIVVGVSGGDRGIGWPDGGYYGILGLCLALMIPAIAGVLRAAVVVTAGSSTRFE